MDITDIKLGLVKYKLELMRLMVPGLDPFDIDEQYISSMIIEKDYDNFYFPFFHIEVSIPGFLYRAMKKDNYNIKANVHLKSAIYYESEPTLKSSTFTTYVNKTFYVFLEDTTPEITENELDAWEKEEGTYKKGYAYGDLYTVKLLLYREDYLFNSKKVLNAVLSSPTLPDALTFVLNQSGLNNVLISPPHNYKSYREFVITPVTAMEQIDRICNEYALHDFGTTIFYDFNFLYLLNKSSSTKAFLQKEIKVTYLASLMTSGPESIQGRGCYTKPNEYYLANIVPDSIITESKSGLNDQTYGNDITVINTATGSVSSVKSGAENNKSANGGRTIINTQAGVPINAIKQSLLEASKVVTLGFSYVDLNMFAPNKEFVLTLEDMKLRKYNGKYRITRMLTVFENEGMFWIPHVTAEFRG